MRVPAVPKEDDRRKGEISPLKMVPSHQPTDATDTDKPAWAERSIMHWVKHQTATTSHGNSIIIETQFTQILSKKSAQHTVYIA